MREFAFVCAIPIDVVAGAPGEFLSPAACAGIYARNCLPVHFACMEKNLTFVPRAKSLDELPLFLGSLAALRLVFYTFNREVREIPVLDCAPRIDASQVIASEHAERLMREQQRTLPPKFGRRSYAPNAVYGIELQRAAPIPHIPPHVDGTAILTLSGIAFDSWREMSQMSGLPDDA